MTACGTLRAKKINAKMMEAATSSLEEEILRYISQFTALSDAESKGIIESLHIQTFQKGTLLLREGQISSLCYFVL